jgi:two-component system chemotaxis response regulator CheB
MEAYRPQQLVAVQLTGMGWDGAESMAELHRRGGRTIAESEETAVIFGMPQELIARQGATVVLPHDEVADQLIAWGMPGRDA